MITRKSQKAKYESDSRYHADPDNLSQETTNRYSLRNNFGLYFELQKIKEVVNLLNYGKIELKGKKIIDVGCHRGFISNILAQIKGSSSGVYGTDLIHPFIDQAKLINPGVQFSQHDVYEELPYEQEYFDLITAIYLFNAIPLEDQQEISNKLSEKVKIGGHIIFFDLLESKSARFAQKISHINKKYIPLPHFNDKRIKELFPKFTIVKSKKMLNVLTYRTINFSWGATELLDRLLPKEYYIVLLKKTK